MSPGHQPPPHTLALGHTLKIESGAQTQDGSCLRRDPITSPQNYPPSGTMAEGCVCVCRCVRACVRVFLRLRTCVCLLCVHVCVYVRLGVYGLLAARMRVCAPTCRLSARVKRIRL